MLHGGKLKEQFNGYMFLKQNYAADTVEDETINVKKFKQQMQEAFCIFVCYIHVQNMGLNPCGQHEKKREYSLTNFKE